MCIICQLTTTFDPNRHIEITPNRADSNNGITTLTTAPTNPYIAGLTTEAGQPTPVIYTPGSTITYFFDTDARAWSDAEKAAVTSAWEAWEAFINLNIEETTVRENATVLMQISNLPADVAGQATAPVDGAIPAFNQTAAAAGALSFLEPGGDSYLTLIHEIGHNLGIYHPHDGTLFPGVNDNVSSDLGTNGLSQNIWTVMSYNAGYTVEPQTDLAFGTARTPMTLDIAAAQFAYGARAANTGDNVYELPTANGVGTGWTAIWDTGGSDTISASNATGNTNIDLRAATLAGENAGGHVSWTPGIKGGVTIAQNVIVENAIGGSGDDTIIGNDAGNIITGGGGNDTIDGGAGTDTALYAGATSNYTVGINSSGTITITDRNGQDGADLLQGMEQGQFVDRMLDFDQYVSTASLSPADFTALAEMYVAYFNRAADAEGLYFWADKLAEGMSLNTIANLFFDQEETRTLYTNPDDTDAFVTAVYANVLGRTPDAGGFDFWKGVVGSGAVSQGAFVLEVIGGAKAGGNAADIDYLTQKANLGIYFSAIQGMSDTSDARSVLDTFGDQATSNLAAARSEIDAHFADATTNGAGDFLFTLIGVIDDPFANVA